MRVTVKFNDADGQPADIPDVDTQLSGNPGIGETIDFNSIYYTIEEVRWNGNPAPMRRTDMSITVKPV